MTERKIPSSELARSRYNLRSRKRPNIEEKAPEQSQRKKLKPLPSGETVVGKLPKSGKIFCCTPEKMTKADPNLPERVGRVISYISNRLSGPQSVDTPAPSVNSESIEGLFDKKTYNPDLNIFLAPLREEENGMSYIGVKLPKGTQLIPHLHEKGSEVAFPVTSGVIYLGDASKDEEGNYNRDKDGKVMVDWEKPLQVEPVKPLDILPGKAHHFAANNEGAFYSILGLPTSHFKAGENGKIDREWTTYPSKPSLPLPLS